MKTVPKEKPRLTMLTDPAEIEAVNRNDRLNDILGFHLCGVYWGYTWSVERWRKRSREEGKHE